MKEYEFTITCIIHKTHPMTACSCHLRTKWRLSSPYNSADMEALE